MLRTSPRTTRHRTWRWWMACVLTSLLVGCGGGEDTRSGQADDEMGEQAADPPAQAPATDTDAPVDAPAAPVDEAPAPPPSLQLSASALSYGNKAVFTLSGTLVPQAETVTVSKCKGLAVEATPGAADKAVSCTVNDAGTLQLEVRDATGTVLAAETFEVPAPQVRLDTDLGSLTVELDPATAPATVANFIGYVSAGFYDGTLIHRVVPGFVVQGGWLNPTPAIQPGAGAPIALEAGRGLRHLRGTLGMARSAEPDSATTQFFFNLQDNPGLDAAGESQPGYAAFGRIVQGLDIMDLIGAAATGPRWGLVDVPLSDIVVRSVSQVQ